VAGTLSVAADARSPIFGAKSISADTKSVIDDPSRATFRTRDCEHRRRKCRVPH